MWKAMMMQEMSDEVSDMQSKTLFSSVSFTIKILYGAGAEQTPALLFFICKYKLNFKNTRKK